MDIFNVLTLFCGLALFLYGMEVMGDALKKSAGSKLKMILGKMTSNPAKGFILGLAVTAVIQSSSATTVMVVGFVNSGTMTLLQSVGVIMGANLGTAVTAWLTALSSVGKGEEALEWIKWLKPDSWMPILAVIGICFLMFAKRDKKKGVGTILLGFSVLMVGMDLMSGAVGGLKGDPAFQSILTMFENPILGIFAGLILTVIVQSSSASVGILQSLTVTGAITYGAAIPIIMGQNIGTCVTALISSVGANKNGKRAAMIHLYFNIIGVLVWLSIFYITNAIFSFFPVENAINAWGVAAVHTVFKILSVLIMAPFYRWLEKLAVITVRDKKSDDDRVNALDERLFNTPSVAVEQATRVAYNMADVSFRAFANALVAYDNYSLKLADEIRELEGKADKYEDDLGSYLVKLSSHDLSSADAAQVTKLLHIIGDLERVSDHAVNIVESVEEMRDKEIEFSSEAKREIGVMMMALSEIIGITKQAFVGNDLKFALKIEPLEEAIDELRDEIKLNHVIRLQKSECTIEHGFILNDILTNFERVSDHCSNIGSCVVEVSKYDDFEMHKYKNSVKKDTEHFENQVAEYRKKYNLA